MNSHGVHQDGPELSVYLPVAAPTQPRMQRAGLLAPRASPVCDIGSKFTKIENRKENTPNSHIVNKVGIMRPGSDRCCRY